jgi:branched-chain amino acid transport system permease protein
VGVAASMKAPPYPTQPTSGVYFVLMAFVTVVLGGLGSIGGAFAEAMVIGLIDSLSAFYIRPTSGRLPSSASSLPS